MTTLDVEYAIKTDVRNNPVIREVDTRQERDLRRMVCLVVITVATCLLAAWQYSTVQQIRKETEDLKAARAAAEVQNRQLRLNYEWARSPDTVERRARALGMRPAHLSESLILERHPAAPPEGGVMARVQ